MKLSFTKASLAAGINIVSKAVPAKTTMTILECILIDASAGEIKLTANDMELGIETVVEGQILEKGRIAIEAKLFSEIIRKLPDSEILIESDDKYNVSITCEKADFKITGKEADEFSYLPMIEKDDYISVSQFTLKEMIRQTIFSIAAGDVNKLMTGELFEVNENELKITSLDGHRISIRKVRLRDSYAPQKVVVPGKTLTEISKILSGEADKDVLIFFGPNHILFEFDRTLVVSRLIEGEYFRVQQMLSGDYETKMTINKKDFLDSIDRSVLLIRENDKKPIILNLQDQMLEMSLTSMMGTMKEEILVNKQGKDIMIGFNPKFLIDALRVIDDETVDIYMVNSKAPCFIRDEEENYIYLILPVNFNRV
ncbi:MAG: DNA polymerase III subunit beta [Lachnospiraceae bacterium]|jgi:DNA polymerase-3 subunit beta|nr:DNA polymerase III subunit beta [Lachnospiraceae bacterium]